MTFSEIPVGDAVIDLDNQTAYSNNNGTITDLMQYYLPTSEFIIPRAGSITISGTGTIYFRERWQ